MNWRSGELRGPRSSTSRSSLARISMAASVASDQREHSPSSANMARLTTCRPRFADLPATSPRFVGPIPGLQSQTPFPLNPPPPTVRVSSAFYATNVSFHDSVCPTRSIARSTLKPTQYPRAYSIEVERIVAHTNQFEVGQIIDAELPNVAVVGLETDVI